MKLQPIPQATWMRYADPANLPSGVLSSVAERFASQTVVASMSRKHRMHVEGCRQFDSSSASAVIWASAPTTSCCSVIDHPLGALAREVDHIAKFTKTLSELQPGECWAEFARVRKISEARVELDRFSACVNEQQFIELLPALVELDSQLSKLAASIDPVARQRSLELVQIARVIQGPRKNTFTHSEITKHAPMSVRVASQRSYPPAWLRLNVLSLLEEGYCSTTVTNVVESMFPGTGVIDWMETLEAEIDLIDRQPRYHVALHKELDWELEDNLQKGTSAGYGDWYTLAVSDFELTWLAFLAVPVAKLDGSGIDDVSTDRAYEKLWRLTKRNPLS